MGQPPTTPIRFYPGPPTDFESLARQVALAIGDGNLVTVALAVARGACRIPQNQVHAEGVGTSWQIASAILAILSADEVAQFDQDPRRQPISDALVRGIVVASQHLASKQREEDTENPGALLATLAFAESLFGQDALGDSGTLPSIARASILLGLDGFPGLPDIHAGPTAARVDELLVERYGLSYVRFVSCVFVIYSSALLNGSLNLAQISESLAGPGSLIADLRAFVSLNQKGAQDVRAAILGGDVDGMLESLALLFFSSTPLIQVAPNHYLAAPHPYILDRIGMGLIRELTAIERGLPPAVNPLTELLGRRLESYVGALLRLRPGRAQIFPEYYVLRNGNELSADWTLFAEDECVLIECKRRPIPRGAFFAYSEDDTRGALRQLGDHVVQTLNGLERALAALDEGRHRQETQHISQAVRDSAAWHIVVVYPELPPVQTLFKFQEILEERVAEHVAQACPRVRLANKLASVVLLRCSDLEWVVASHSVERLPTLLRTFHGSVGSATARAMIADGRMPPTFRNVVIDFARGPIPALDELLEVGRRAMARFAAHLQDQAPGPEL